MPSPRNQVIWTVSALNREVKTLLERGIGRLWLEGEISNLSRPGSGHWYFTLKDNNAQIRVAMFKGKNQRIKFDVQNGQQVLIQASVSLYEARGEFQVIAEHLEEAGTGKLMREFEALKNKLQVEGLFEATFKQSIPSYPKKIGIITSPTGAAIKDALSVLKRRSPITEVLIYPCMVQGEQATKEIINALKNALTENQCDVILIIRGGGSIEDLWCFNNEELAYLIYQSSIPIITGIGHEIDFTIADFVADYRAPTPSVAAESAVTDQNETQQQLDYKLNQLYQAILAKLQKAKFPLLQAQQKLLQKHPKARLKQQQHQLSMLQVHLNQLVFTNLEKLKFKQSNLHNQLIAFTPKQKINDLKIKTANLQQQLLSLGKLNVSHSKQKLALLTGKLDAISPLKTLSRGYAIVSHKQQQIQSITQLKKGHTIQTQLSDGVVDSKITAIKKQ